MPALNQFFHMSKKEGKQQGPYVRPVDIRVGHDNNAVVTQFICIKFVFTNAATERCYDCTDLS